MWKTKDKLPAENQTILFETKRKGFALGVRYLNVIFFNGQPIAKVTEIERWVPLSTVVSLVNN